MKLQFNKIYLILFSLILSIEILIATFIKSGFIRHTLGDVLAVILVYTLIKGCTNLRIVKSALLALFMAFMIEFLQLTSFAEYFNLKDYPTLYIVLGNTFSLNDLTAYTAGIILTLSIEYINGKI